MPIEQAVPTHPPSTRKLMDEFVVLQKQQWAALDQAIFLGMTVTEAQQYERRAQRIVELQCVLGVNLTYHKDRLQNPPAKQ